MGGALGARGRYGLAGVVQRGASSAFPWGTVAVNLLGCLMFGFLWAVAEKRLSVSGEVRAAIFIGFLGSFTTFSTFAFETAARLQDAEWVSALGNLALQNLIGIVCIFLGLALGRLV
ncbi:CrcB family protein [bacterium]|nr:CrcB family protein [bacterium]